MARHVRVQPAGAGQLSYDVTSEAAMTGEDLSKLNPGTLCVTLDTGATYEAYPTGTTPPVGATTIAAINGVWLYVSTAGTRPTSAIIFRPGVASAGPAVETWPEIQAADAAALGTITNYIDGQTAACHVPAASGITDCQGGVVFTSYNQLGGAGGPAQQTLTIDDTAVLHRPRAFQSCAIVCACTTTTALTFDYTAPSDTLILSDVSVALSATATVPAIDVAAAGRLDLTCVSLVTILDSSLAGAVPVIRLGANATLNWTAFGGVILLGTNTITGPASATINFTHDNFTPLPNFAAMGFAGTVNEIRSSLAAWNKPAAGSTANRPAPPNVQEGQLYFDNTIGQLVAWTQAGGATAWMGLPGTPGQPYPIYVVEVGDSNTQGAQFAGYRQQFWSILRARRGDLRMIGPFAGEGDGGRYVLAEWNTPAIGGSTLTSWTTGGANPYATNVVVDFGQPTCVLVMLGSNDLVVGGMTLPTMEANFNAFAAATIAASPAARVIVSSIPPRLDSGGAVAALGVAYNGALPTLVAALGNPLWTFWDGCQGMTAADLNTDNLHLNEYGAAKLGAQLATAFQQAFPSNAGLIYPRIFSPRTQPKVLRLSATAADYFLTTGASQYPTTDQSFSVAFWFNPDSIAAGSNQALLTSAVANGMTIRLAGLAATPPQARVDVFFDSPASTTSAGLVQFCAPGQWTWLQVTFSYLDPMTPAGSTGILSIWANGMLLAAVGITAPSFTNATDWFLGYSPDRGLNGLVGEFSDFQGSFGTNVPLWPGMAPPVGAAGTGQIRDTVERGYFEGAGVPSPGFDFRLNNSAADALGGANGNLGGAAAYITPTVAMPIDPLTPANPVTEPFIFGAASSLTTQVQQAIPHGSGTTTSSADLVLGGIAPTSGTVSRMAIQHTGNAGNVGGQTITYQVFKNTVAVTPAIIAGVAATAGTKTAQLTFEPIPYAAGDVFVIQLLPSGVLTAALTDVMASVS